MTDPTTVRRVVVRLWSCAILLHLIGNPASWHGDVVPAGGGVLVILLAVVAVGAFVQPDNRPTTVLAAVLVVALALVRLPVLANNLVLTAVVGIALHTSRDAATAVRTVLRAGATAYLFAALAKYNTAFLDPSTSCAPLILDRMVASAGLAPVPGWLSDAAPVATLVVESLVAVGLLVPGARRWGATLGVLFHGLLAYDLGQHFWDFTSALLPVFAAAAPWVAVAAVARIRRVVPRWAAVAGVAAAGAAAVASALDVPSEVLQVVGHVLWIAGGSLLLLSWATVALRRREAAATPLQAAYRSVAGTVLVSLVALNGVLPYAQVKTGYGWNMYSNLLVAQAYSNHLLVPAFALRHAYDDLVTVTAASDRRVLAYTSELEAGVPRVQLEAWVAATPGARVTFVDGAGRSETLRHVDLRGQRHLLARVAPLRPVTERCLLAYGPAG